ncbi:MAG: response regulator [Deltaproteobacteria bacterium]
MSYEFLLVDDSSITRKVLRRTLRMSGLEVSGVHEAANGIEALDVLSQRRIDVVVTDLNMPAMDGVQLVETMVSLGRLAETAVVVVSSDRNIARLDHLRALGAFRCLAKPFRPEELCDSVTEALRARTGGAA